MESHGNNHGFLDGNKRIAFTAADVFLRRNGFLIEVEGVAGTAVIVGSMERNEFRFPKSSTGSAGTSSRLLKLYLLSAAPADAPLRFDVAACQAALLEILLVVIFSGIKRDCRNDLRHDQF